VNEQSMAEWSAALLVSAKARLVGLGADLAQAPLEAQRAFDTVHATLMTGAGVRAATHIAILLFTGIAVEWLYWTYAYSPLRAAMATPVHTPADALRVGLRRLLLAVSGLLLFTAAAIGVSAAFAWPPHVHELIIAVTLLLLVLRLSWIGVSVAIAPGRPRLRLVPVAQPQARWLAAAAMS